MATLKHKENKVRYAGVPHVVMRHPDYIKLGSSARSLLFEFSLQYNGKNNGKLCAIHAQLKTRGFGAKDTVTNAIRELENANLILRTKVGYYGKGKRLPNYFAVTWRAIDEIIDFDMDVKPTKRPPRQFSIELRAIKNEQAA